MPDPLRWLLIALYAILIVELFATEQVGRWPWFTVYMASAMFSTINFDPITPHGWNLDWYRGWWIKGMPVRQVLLWAMALESAWKAMPWRLGRDRWAILALGVALGGASVGTLYGLHRLGDGLNQMAGWKAYSNVARAMMLASVLFMLSIWIRDTTNLGHLCLAWCWCGIFAVTSLVDFGAPMAGDRVAWHANTNVGAVGLGIVLLMWMVEKQLNKHKATKDEGEL